MREDASARCSDGIAGAAQHGADAGQQFARIERLRYIVVCAKFQADDPVGFLPHRGQHHDRHIGLAAEPAGKVQPAFTGQHQIEHDQVVVAVGEGAPSLPGVAHRGDPHAVLLFQETRQQIADFPVVVHHQDVRHLFHALLHTAFLSAPAE